MAGGQYHPFGLVAMLAALLLAAPVAAGAAESGPVSSERATVSLVSDTDRVAPGAPFRIGLRFRLAPGWHTYWKNPGDAGVAAELDLTLPQGTTAGPIVWPTPERVNEEPVATYAYNGNLLLPVTVTPARDGGPVAIEAEARWLVCKEICVPEQGKFRLNLPAGANAPSAEAALFAEADRRTPRPSPWHASIAPDGTLRVEGAELSRDSVADAWFMPAEAGVIDHGAPQALTVRAGQFTLALKPDRDFKANAPLAGVLVVRDRSGQQIDVDLSAAPGGAPATPVAPLPRLLGLALLGGLILNLMPCVFPVLAMKAVALAGSAARGEVRAHALSYAAGVMTTFAGLGAVLLAARAGGSAAGWGFQFQSPVFVAAMAWLIFAVGLNLSGVFQVGGRVSGAGQRLAARGGHLGSFFTGLLAVLVATPCTAPFMGAAIAGALAAPPSVTILVFLAMGLGLAGPYVALAALPGLARLAPRPGRWMDILRQALAFPMYGAAVWLVWVMAQEAGPTGVLATAIGILLIGFAAWTLGLTQDSASRGARRLGQSLTFAALLAAAAVASDIAATPPAATAPAETGVEAFTSDRLATLRAAGKPVFVNMTAAWCVTCLVNERVAIGTETVRTAFAEQGITYLKGDWTRQDQAITDFLRAHGRDGVPLYVFYPTGNGASVVLPQILTGGAILAAINPN
jgi:thiol:disulfide interchange protein